MYALVLSFQNWKGFVILIRKWLRLKKKIVVYQLVYLFVSLTFILLVATARHYEKNMFSYENCEYDNLIVYIEKDISCSI